MNRSLSFNGDVALRLLLLRLSLIESELVGAQRVSDENQANRGADFGRLREVRTPQVGDRESALELSRRSQVIHDSWHTLRHTAERLFDNNPISD